MSSAFHGISTMNSALRAFQRALDVTGHNISNVNTAGYSRQDISLVENTPTGFSGLSGYMMGNGVNIDSVKRAQSNFLAARQMGTLSEGGRLDSLLGGLKSIQSMTLEPGGASVGDALDKFFNAWSALGSNPGQASLRQQVQQAGSTLTSRIRGLYSDIQGQAGEATAQAADALKQINQLSGDIANLNRDIRMNQAGGATPNDLLDMRDQKLNQLSQLVGVRVDRMQDGGVNVYMGNLTLVDQTGTHATPGNFDAQAGTLSDGTNTYPVSGGTLQGLSQMVQSANGYIAKLDTFADTLRQQFNTLHSTGTNGLGATNQNFFDTSTSGAFKFDLDAGIKADPNAIATGASGSPGDGGLALSLSKLRDQSIASLGGKTLTQFNTDLVGNIAQDVSFAGTQQDTQVAISQQVNSQIQDVSGVSLDDEMSQMLRYQRSYQAAAKALSIFDQTTEDLLNMVK